MEIYNLFLKLPIQIIASSLLWVNLISVKTLRQWRQIQEAKSDKTLTTAKIKGMKQ
jgi:hypothetical protein